MAREGLAPPARIRDSRLMDVSLATRKDARSAAPRSSHADWQPADDLRDPVELLEEQGQKRVQELLPIRYGRMSASPFAFYRGAAYVMAFDLATTPQTGIRVQLCGDAHLSNFGGFASPERDVVFDLNDFDETLPGPWEWDVKRLAASLAVAGRDRGFSAKQRREILGASMAAYRNVMTQVAELNELDMWYLRVDENVINEQFRAVATDKQVRRFEKGMAKARAKDSTRAFNKLAATVDGSPKIIADPPLVVPIADLVPEAEAETLTNGMLELLSTYKESLPTYLCNLLDRYEF